MNRSGSQTFLLVISILDIVAGAFGIITAIMTGMAGAAAGAGAAGIVGSSEMAASGVTASDAGVAAAGLSLITVLLFVSAGVAIVEGILGIRAANDNRKIMPVWIIAIIGLAFAVISVIASIVSGKFTFSVLGSLIGSGLMFWIANNIKQQAGL